jgi:hypothetical protein
MQYDRASRTVYSTASMQESVSPDYWIANVREMSRIKMRSEALFACHID